MEVEIKSRPSLGGVDKKRAEHQALRSRLLSNSPGAWASDLEQALNKHIRAERRAVWGIAEMSRNPFRSLATQIGGALYQAPPTVRGLAGSEGVTAAVEQAGYWQLMQAVSTDLVGIREALVRVDWTERGGLLLRPVPCELARVTAVPEQPDVPACVEEIQQRVDPETGKPAWCWEILDITDLANPQHLILSGDRKKDWTAAFLGGNKSGADYQYRDSQGKPYLPIVMYHAEKTGRLWNSYYGVEAVMGTLTMGVLLTFWMHGFKDGSFATVFLAGGKVVGLEVENQAGVRTQVISTEPGAVVEVAPSDDYTGQVTVTQIQPGFDPEKAMNSIGLFESGLAEYAGVSAADIVRTGADPRSGASLSISRAGLRSAQGRYEPQLRRGDLEVLSVAAKVLNGATGSNYPESGYSISYPSLPLSSEEISSQREDILAKVGNGLMSKVDGYIRLHPGLGREQAKEELRRIRKENAEAEAVEPSADLPGLPVPNATDVLGAPAPAEPAANTALNGAQVQAAQGIVTAVAAGQLPRASGVSMLVEFFNLSPASAERVMGDVGRSFRPTPTV